MINRLIDGLDYEYFERHHKTACEKMIMCGDSRNYDGNDGGCGYCDARNWCGLMDKVRKEIAK